jgi:hypothetical protein
MSKIEVNAIEPQCGTTLTVGASGDTITFPTGTTIVNNGTQTGFGRTGTVDWDTTPKTATFSAVSGNGYFCNTSGGAFTVNLPAGSAGAIVSLADYAATWQTNNLTVSANGSEKIGGNVNDVALSTEGQSITLVYVDSTQGWINTMDSTSNVRGISPFLEATGGTETTCGDYKIHTFTGPGTFCVTSGGTPAGSTTVEYIVVAGGGGGGRGYYGGGGGAGGFRFASPSLAPATYPAKPLAGPAGLSVPVASYPIVVGAGGAVQPPSSKNPGSNSSFSTITSTGGGAGGNRLPPLSNQSGSNGGSGGGAANDAGSSVGSGNTPPVSPPQGNNGGTHYGGAGGGATAVGGSHPGGSGPYGAVGGAGGGFPNAFGTSGESSSPFYYFSGGGGGGGCLSTPSNAGGIGGGGDGGRCGGCGTGQAGTTNTGGGGGGGGGNDSLSGAGGSGIVIIRYKFQ